MERQKILVKPEDILVPTKCGEEFMNEVWGSGTGTEPKTIVVVSISLEGSVSGMAIGESGIDCISIPREFLTTDYFTLTAASVN